MSEEKKKKEEMNPDDHMGAWPEYYDQEHKGNMEFFKKNNPEYAKMLEEIQAKNKPVKKSYYIEAPKKK